MDIDEIRDSVKNFIESRIRNPYFGSVIFVWCYINRVVIFGLFNFDDSVSFGQRLSWTYQQFQSFKFPFVDFHGLSATIILSLILGFVFMVVYDKVGALARVIFKLANKSTIWLLRQVEPSKWIDVEKFIETQAKLNDSEEELNKKKLEYHALQREYDLMINRNSAIEKERIQEQKLLIESSERIKVYEEQVRQNIEEKNKFIIKYARYGKYGSFVEVTKTVAELLTTKGKFSIDNSELGFDPAPFKVKEIFIEYQYDNSTESVVANENEVVELIENGLVISSTPESEIKQGWLENLSKLTKLFEGDWIQNLSTDIGTQNEKVNFTDSGKYLVDGKPVFDIQVEQFSNDNIVLRKINSKGDVYSNENLSLINDGVVSGRDTNGNIVAYEKIKN